MPEVVGFREADVLALLQDQGLVLAEEGGLVRRFDDLAPAGEVLDQNPKPGEDVKPGDVFYLVVSDGPEIIDIPDVAGQDAAQATQALTEAGFQVREESENSSSVPDGDVIRTDPDFGDRAPRGSVVVIIVSDGPPPIVMVTVPNVVNQTQATAESQLTGRGLNPGVSFATSATVPSGSVISQGIAPGTSVARGTSVPIVVSQGPPAPTSSTTTTTP